MSPKKRSKPTKSIKTAKAITQPIIPTEKVSAESGQRQRNVVIVAIAIILLLGLAAYQLRGQFIVATVNGEHISRLALIQELEKQGKEQTLENMVLKKLITQQARTQQVEISSEELQSKVTEIESNISAQGQELDQLLAMQGMTRDDLYEQISMELLIERMATASITIDQEDIDDYIEQNRELFPPDAEDEELDNQVRQMLVQEQKDQAVQVWLDQLQNQADITYH